MKSKNIVIFKDIMADDDISYTVYWNDVYGGEYLENDIDLQKFRDMGGVEHDGLDNR